MMIAFDDMNSGEFIDDSKMAALIQETASDVVGKQHADAHVAGLHAEAAVLHVEGVVPVIEDQLERTAM